MNNQEHVKEWMRLAGQATPDKPVIPDLRTRILRAKLMLEETIETIVYGLGLEIYAKNGPIIHSIDDIDFSASTLWTPNLIALADGLADKEVVDLGTAVACGIQLQPIFEAVMTSNLTKFNWTKRELDTLPNGYSKTRLPAVGYCVKNEFGKVMKPENHKSPNIAPILISQGMTQ